MRNDYFEFFVTCWTTITAVTCNIQSHPSTSYECSINTFSKKSLFVYMNMGIRISYYLSILSYCNKSLSTKTAQIKQTQSSWLSRSEFIKSFNYTQCSLSKSLTRFSAFKTLKVMDICVYLARRPLWIEHNLNYLHTIGWPIFFFYCLHILKCCIICSYIAVTKVYCTDLT